MPTVSRASTILFAYEFGAGLGHVNALIAVAERLAEKHRLVFALPDAALGARALRRAFGGQVEIVQAPLWPAPASPDAHKVPTDTLADVLRLFGFDQRRRVIEATQRWIGILRQVSPALIVADFAPTLRLASAGRIPTVIVGNGYATPPSGRPLPPLRPWKAAVPEESRAHERQLLDAVNAAQCELFGPGFSHFSDLFQGERTFVCTIAEFDPYRPWRAEPPSWPLNVPPIVKGRNFADRGGPAAFCYFPPIHPALPEMLAALSALGRPSEVYIPGADAQHLLRHCSRNVRLHDEPVNFAELLPESLILIHHAGLSTAYAGLAAGVPQLVMPLSLEHAITSRALQAFNVAEVLRTPLPKAGNLVGLLDALICDTARQSASLRAADELAKRRASDPIGPVVAACEDLI